MRKKYDDNRWLALLSLTVLACGSSNSGSGPSGGDRPTVSATTAASYEGQYSLDTYTINEGACDVPETRTLSLPDGSPGPKGCFDLSPAEWRQQAMDRPCTRLRVVGGSRTGPLPG